ncbi:MAG: HAD family hydrolase [Burkholderiales bacterium]|nr:HAD family hydrolase [Burkholderiales bacterium]
MAAHPIEVTGFGLVIFDCDGVLIDSEPIANLVFSRRLAAVGIQMSPEEVMRTFVGRSRDTCIAMAGEMRGEKLPADFAAKWDEALHEALEREVKPIDGVPELLRSLPIPYCVASNGEPGHMERGLRAAGLMPLVEGRLFSAAQVARPKPAPDVYLHAARTMGFPPSRCAVVEDTPTGAESGVAAGMKVFGYVAGPQSDREAMRALGATTFTRMSELPALFGVA